MNSFLRANIHAQRDPEIKLKFKDGGKEFMQQLGEHEMESPL